MKNHFLIFVIALLSSVSVFGNSVSGGDTCKYISSVDTIYYSMNGEQILRISDKDFYLKNKKFPIVNTPYPMYIICIIVDGHIVKTKKYINLKWEK